MVLHLPLNSWKSASMYQVQMTRSPCFKKPNPHRKALKDEMQCGERKDRQTNRQTHQGISRYQSGQSAQSTLQMSLTAEAGETSSKKYPYESCKLKET